MKINEGCNIYIYKGALDQVDDSLKCASIKRYFVIIFTLT